MISNERSSLLRRWSDLPPKPHVVEDTLKSSQLQVERKFFVFSLKENSRGRLLRITEELGGRRNSIIVPSTGLADFKKILEEMISASEKLPSTFNEPPVEPGHNSAL